MGTTSCRGILHGTATPYRQSTISEPTRYILILRTVKCSRRKEVPDEARLQPQEVLLSMACGELRQKLNKKLTKLKILSIIIVLFIFFYNIIMNKKHHINKYIKYHHTCYYKLKYSYTAPYIRIPAINTF